MKIRTFNRQAAAGILILYRDAVKVNKENPTLSNWDDVRHYYKRVSTMGLLGVISRDAQLRAAKMFDECTAVI